MVTSNNGSKHILEARDNKFEVAIVADGMMLEMNLTVDEMQDIIDYASAEIQKIKAI